jgi:para-aminobenzoate synthetase component 1
MTRAESPARPLDVARRLHAEGAEPALLLAAAPGPHPARTVLGIAPGDTVVTAAGSGAGLPAIPPRLVHTAHGAGVWIGAIAYDAGLGLHGIGSRHEPVVPSVLAAWYPTYAVHDDSGWAVHGSDADSRRTLTDAIASPLAAGERPHLVARTATSSLTRAEHAASVREAQRLIALGELFEVNLAHVLEVPWETGAFDLFERLVATSPGDHSAYLAIGDTAVASVSPESFLRIDGDRCETRPIKGTRRRSRDPQEDAALEAELRASVKDRAENVMIVDLLRNDLTATAVAGSVTVEALCLVERTASVMHLVSVVSSRIREEVRSPDVLVSCFPGGSITGAPKRRAMEIIDRLERAPRGFYCGSVFSWEPAERRLVASIAIRTATVRAGLATYGAGGAVTLLSDPDEEAEETIIKARPFLTATNAVPAGW